MPVWSFEEIKVIIPCFPKAEHVWKRRFEVLGGIPRLVLEDLSRDPARLMDYACRLFDMDHCFTDLSSLSDMPNELSHTILHIYSSAPHTRASFDFASDYARELVMTLTRSRGRRKLLSTLEELQILPSTASICDYIFQYHAIEALQLGGVFTCRGFDNDDQTETSQVTIKPSTRRIVQDLEDGQEDYVLHIPESKTLAGIDAWIPRVGGLQMTVTVKHDLTVAQSKLERLGDGAAKVYWALTPNNFYAFRPPTSPIKQLALMIPYELRTTRIV